MSYIGATQGTSSPVLLDSITVVNNQAAYTMQKDGVNYTPASTLVMQVSLNGLIQQPNSSYTINGSTITFDSALVTGDVIDYILVREPTTGTIAPIDGSITTSKLVDGAVTNAKITSMASSKLTGALPAIDGSALTGVSAGKLLNMEHALFSNQNQTTTSSTFQDSGIEDTITPSSTSSKILGFISFTASFDAYANSGVNGEYRIMRGTTEVTRRRLNSWTDTGTNPTTITFVDSPATTSAVTYTLEYARTGSYAGNPNVGIGSNTANIDDEVILLEIGA